MISVQQTELSLCLNWKQTLLESQVQHLLALFLLYFGCFNQTVFLFCSHIFFLFRLVPASSWISCRGQLLLKISAALCSSVFSLWFYYFHFSCFIFLYGEAYMDLWLWLNNLATHTEPSWHRNIPNCTDLHKNPVLSGAVIQEQKFWVDRCTLSLFSAALVKRTFGFCDWFPPSSVAAVWVAWMLPAERLLSKYKHTPKAECWDKTTNVFTKFQSS